MDVDVEAAAEDAPLEVVLACPRLPAAGPDLVPNSFDPGVA
jgi:hypothetical protein